MSQPRTTKLVVLNVVGLTPGLLGENTPHLGELAESGFQAELAPVFPAVTCSAQATMLTGRPPRDHGIVGNGWYFRDLAEVWLWRQSNHLVHGEKVWERIGRSVPDFTCAKLFWWYNMHSSATWSVTPRPVYHADGRTSPSIYTSPPELKRICDEKLGGFPLFDFWGPRAGLPSTEWIAGCAKEVIERYRPDLTLVYLPHLDYDLQRFGPDDHKSIPQALRDVDRVAGEIIELARSRDFEVLVVSEYGITSVTGSVSINRVLRHEGLLEVQETIAGELLDTGASRAFAVSDHQAAHVYVREAEDLPAVRRLLEGTDGIEDVLDEEGKAALGLDHPRSGELVAIARADRWFDYYYWLDDARAPDFARTVDIHAKPGYDPAELFLDPHRPLVKLSLLGKLFLKKLGFRALLDVVPLDSSVVRGSHGRLPDRPEDGPLVLSSTRRVKTSRLEMLAVADLIEDICLGG